MSAFTSRTAGYKAGVFLLFFASLLFFVGYAAPYWATAELITSASGFVTTTYSEGIWMLCVSATAAGYSATSCGSYGLTGFPGWFHAVRGMESIGIIGVIVSCIYALATNCCRAFPGPRTRFLEIFAGITGIFAFIGCMVYVGLRNEKSGSTTHGGIGTYLSIFFNVQEWKFAWAFYLAAVGSILFVIAAVLIAVFNKPVEGVSQGGGMVMTTVTQGQTAVAGPYAQPQPYLAQPGNYNPPPKAGYPDPQSYPNYPGQRY